MRDEIKRAPKIASVAVIVMVAAFALAAWSFQQAHTSACQARDTTLTVMARILADAQAQSGNNARATRFYTAEINRINHVRC